MKRVRQCPARVQPDPARQLEVIYDVKTNRLYLKGDDNVGLLGGFAPGSANVIRNSRGSIDCAATRVTKAGDTITVNWSVRATPTLAGSNTIWLRVLDRSGLDTLYQKQVGATWNIA